MKTAHDRHRGFPALERALEYAHDHFAKPIPVQQLADLAGLSLWRFSIVFRRHMGVPPHRYISRLRVERACELLRQGMTAAEVATVCGFYDQSHFSRHFKQHYGMTPGQYALRPDSWPAAVPPVQATEPAGAQDPSIPPLQQATG